MNKMLDLSLCLLGMIARVGETILDKDGSVVKDQQLRLQVLRRVGEDIEVAKIPSPS